VVHSHSMSDGSLAPHEKAILAAVGVYCPPGTSVPIAWTDIEQGGGRYALIGSLCFPPDLNSRQPAESERRRWRLAISSLEGHGFIRRGGPDLYDITDSGRKRIGQLKSSRRRTGKGKPVWDAVVEQLSELVALQNPALNPPSIQTDTLISVAAARLLELASAL
jgi:hypothetical protein